MSVDGRVKDPSDPLWRLVEVFENRLDELSESVATSTKPLAQSFMSPNEHDSNLETANVVDGLFFIGRAIHRLAAAIEGTK
jgi:hypothetical protein